MRIHGVYPTNSPYRLKKTERIKARDEQEKSFKVTEEEEDRGEKDESVFQKVAARYDFTYALGEEVHDVADKLYEARLIEKPIYLHLIFEAKQKQGERLNWLEHFKQLSTSAQLANRLLQAEQSRMVVQLLQRLSA
ncbi:hypothetical protein IRY55_00095 [Savagea sp. SN6]|uniref:Uncharacterized protein n=1 Tax=Savagea serpentis TaxID=2785297 RepID=A0A8J7KKA7_9BACL|nr:hypothetical protein [Savagea serpentis]MBF4499744.1 hypothetical protein [Savagea serpentis]